MTIPHHFPSLVEGPAQVVLISGAGLSTPDVSGVDCRFKDRLTKVRTTLGVSMGIGQTHEDYFYVLAEAVLNKLTNDEGKPEPESRLWLAEQLVMLSLPWFHS